MKTERLGRWIFTEDGLVPGYVRVEEQEVAEICEGSPPEDSADGILLPAFVNAHTHIGDTIAYPAPKGTVEELVAPPDGYKHRVLRAAPRPAKVEGMRLAMESMSRSGTCTFIDFREEGVEGVRALREAVTEGCPNAVALGRPVSEGTEEAELVSLIGESDGFGISAASDWPADVLQRMSQTARSSGKFFAMHASETVREDIDAILDLKPDFLVHMTKATDDDLTRCASEGIPVVVCPRANAFFGLRPDIARMLCAGVAVALGTDNAMISVPDLLEELQAAYALNRADHSISAEDAVRLATFGGRKVLNAKGKITRTATSWNDHVIVAVRDENPLRDLVTTARSKDIVALVHAGRIRRPRNWSTR